MRKTLLTAAAVTLVLLAAPLPTPAHATPLSACSLNSALARAWFTEPPLEPELRTSEYTGEVVVFGNIFCRHVSVTATFGPQVSWSPVMAGVPGACVPSPDAVGGTAGWCEMHTYQSFQPIGTIITVSVKAVGVDDLGLPVTREGHCWMSYYYGEGPYKSCDPFNP